MIDRLTIYDKVVLAGALAMALGTFLPIVRFPIVGTMNYFAGGRGDGIIILGLAGVIVALLTFGYRRVAALGGVAALVVMSTTIAKVLGVLADARADAFGLAKENPSGGLAVAFAQGVGLEFGWIALLGGAIAVAGAGL